MIKEKLKHDFMDDDIINESLENTKINLKTKVQLLVGKFFIRHKIFGIIINVMFFVFFIVGAYVTTMYVINLIIK